MKSSNTQLIKATVFTLTTALLAGTAQAQTNHNKWQTLALGSCAIELNQTNQQQAFLYCKGAPSKVATAVLNTKGLEKNQLKQLQCHASLNARQINCFTVGIKHAITLTHVAQVGAFNQCRAINWQQDKYLQYQLVGSDCAINKNTNNQLPSIISLTDFIAQTLELHNPMIVNYNGELILEHGASEDDSCYNTSDSDGKTGMDDDPDGKTGMDDDPDGKTGMDDDPDVKTGMDDDPDGKTGMDDDPDLSSCNITSGSDSKTGMDDDPDQD